jgi:hypothetical protein
MAYEKVAPNAAVRLRLGIYSLAILLAFLALLVALLPSDPAMDLGWRLILLLAAAGGLGAGVHAATSFSHHAGVGTLGEEWTWWYILRPALGAGLGILFVLVVTGLGVSDVLKNVPAADAMRTLAGYLALAGLAGMFSRQAIDWLRGIFDSLFRAPDKEEEEDKAERLAQLRGDDADKKQAERAQAPKDAAAPPEARAASTSNLPWRRFVLLYVSAMLLLLAGVAVLTCVVARWLAGATPPDSIECLVSLLVILAAALGATIHVFTSISDFAGRNKLRTQWLWWYILRPFIAAALGLLVYFAARAFWIAEVTTPVHLYTVLVLALLSGTFSKQTVRWLSKLYDAIFNKVEGLEEDKT